MPIMEMDIDDIIVLLKRQNYYLVTSDNGKDPQYDEEGNLLVCKPEGKEMMSIPNVGPLRNLYDLPEDTEESKLQNKTVNVHRTEIEDEHMMVWMGQRSKKCNLATNLLIKLYSSEKYSTMMADKNVIKLKIWESIAADIESQNFKIASNRRQAGLRTFQKWRNLERTYWKYKKNCSSSAQPTMRKPFFFDGLHAILIKQIDYEKRFKLNLQAVEDGAKTDDKDNTTKSDCPRRITSEIDKIPKVLLTRPSPEGVPRNAVESLLTLINSPDYKNVICNNENSDKVWKEIYLTMKNMGFYIAGSTIQAKSQKLCQKWEYIKDLYVKYQYNKSKDINVKRPPYFDLVKSILDEKPIDSNLHEENSEHNSTSMNQLNFNADGMAVNGTRLAADNLLQGNTSSYESLPPSQTEVLLLQIKDLQESMLVSQQEHFKKMSTLLEEQVTQQKILTTLFTKYVAEQTRKKYNII